MLKRLLTHPLAREARLDDPETTTLRRRIIREKPFLERIYTQWYTSLLETVPPGPGIVLELGSGAGFIKELSARCVTSEVFFVPHVDLVCDGCRQPFRDGSVKAILMTDVFHHIPRITDFLLEANRCVRPGGVISMIEPWVSPWSRFVWGKLHHEPFLPDTPNWHFQESGPLSGANGALPWIVLERDLRKFSELMPNWRIETLRPFMPLKYLISGGVSLRSLMPGWSYEFWTLFEACLSPVMRFVSTFAHITLVKNG
jgi:SAM-dependent methyltransferase